MKGIFIKHFATILRVHVGGFANFQYKSGRLLPSLTTLQSLKKKIYQKFVSWQKNVLAKIFFQKNFLVMYLLILTIFSVHLVLCLDLCARTYSSVICIAISISFSVTVSRSCILNKTNIKKNIVRLSGVFQWPFLHTA